MFLAGYSTWFIYKFQEPIALNEKDTVHFSHMYNWIYFQYCYLYFSMFMVFVIVFLYKRMDGKAIGMKPKVHHHHDDDNVKKAAYTINKD